MKIIDKFLNLDLCKEIVPKEGMETGTYKMPVFVEKIGYSGLLITMTSFVCILFFGAYPFQIPPFLLGAILLSVFFIGLLMSLFYFVIHKYIESQSINYLNERRKKHGMDLLDKSWF